ncbi:MAG: InlB B-repeat-containing protein [Clostridia bacterium]|nr:InlB B-repeat-containing protein [Clostridia bacterium]
MAKRKYFRSVILLLLMVLLPALSSCMRAGESMDPGQWGYDAVVIYDALGGSINARGVRETYYMKNSYLFEPSGTINMLIQPVKDGYILAGWYTAKTDIVDENGQVIGYEFKAEDRWDFDEDRVQDNITLYARWIEQGKVNYVDASTGRVMFSKNITKGSAVQPLSGTTEKLVSKPGYTLFGYYADEACSVPYDFSSYTHIELKPSNKELFNQLHEEFPQYIVPFDLETEAFDEQEADPDLYIKKLGYQIVTDDPDIRKQIRARKDEIIHESIQHYIDNTSGKTVYLKYVEGQYIRVSDISQLKEGDRYKLLPEGVDGLILLTDLDFSGLTVETSETLKGTLYGNGHVIKNIQLRVTSRKADLSAEKKGGLFLELDRATIRDVTFENLSIQVNVRSGIDVTIGALAVEATDAVISHVHFHGLTIESGAGDDGKANYLISDLIALSEDCQLDNVTAQDVIIRASDYAKVRSFFETENKNDEGESSF